MTSAHRCPPPPTTSQNDFRLPSLKDLNFYRPSGAQPALPPAQQQDLGSLQPEQPTQPARHNVAYSRPPYQQPQPVPPPPHHQQYTPAGHEVPPLKHENNAYQHPAVSLSVPTSTAMPPPRNEDTAHSPNQQKRQRTAFTVGSRDTRQSHPNVYPHPQYSYPQGSQPPSAAQYHPGLPPTSSHAAHPPPSPHEHIQHHPSHPMPVSGYAYPYVQPRHTLLHPPPSSSQVTQHNPYPPPTHVPPPQAHWAQPHPHQQQQSPTQFQQQPPPPTSQHPQQNAHPMPAPSHHHHHQPQASMPPPSNQPPPAHHHPQQAVPPPPPSAPPTNPPPSQQIPQYHPQQQQYHPQYSHPSQQPQQQPQQAPASFVRPAAINPGSLENRSTHPVAVPPRVPSVQNDAMSEITDHCNVLYSFANQYVTLQQTNPNAQPLPTELEEMSQRALKVVRLLDDFRRIRSPEASEFQTSSTGSALPSNSVVPMQADSPGPGESSRPPKRPWEDVEEGVPAGDAVGFQDQFPTNSSPDPKNQTTAEQDMELIRTKRATSTAIANGSSGQPKSKYRKRSMGQRASPPGKCHSCNIRETPEWRRGPDGARTLCNACGLHYAKLMRKQNKAAGNGEGPPIDLETLRASTRAADNSDKGRNNPSSKQAEPSSSKTSGKNQQNASDTNAEASTSGRHTTPSGPSQTGHQGSFQLMMGPPQDHHPGQSHGHVTHPPIPSSSSSAAPTPMQVDSRATSQHVMTPQMQAMHPPPPPPPPSVTTSGSSHASHAHSQHPPPPPWPTTAATTGAAAAASGVVAAPAATVRGGPAGGSGPVTAFGNPPAQSPVDFMRRQYSIQNNNRSGNQPHQTGSR